MKRRTKILLSAGALLLVLTVGTFAYYAQRPIGSSSVPGDSISAGWSDDGVQRTNLAAGLVKTTTHGYRAAELGRVTLVVVTPLPLVDLTSIVDKKVQQVLAENDATATAAGGGLIPIAGLQAPYRAFRVHATDGTWDGELLRATYTCPKTGDFVAAVAFGVTEKLGVFRRTFDQARDMVEASRCG